MMLRSASRREAAGPMSRSVTAACIVPPQVRKSFALKSRPVTSRDVNEYLHETLGVPFSAKDFRTWGGTLRAATVLAELGPARSETEAKRNVATAMRLVAVELGNTPAICRKSYVHPIVVARYLDDGETISLPAGHRADGAEYAHSPEERALIRFLDLHFPERRRRSRSAE
jgi:DNA topoisomerase-1